MKKKKQNIMFLVNFVFRSKEEKQTWFNGWNIYGDCNVCAIVSWENRIFGRCIIIAV